jgi:anti-anti-sigma factor
MVIEESVEVTFPRARACVVVVRGDQDTTTAVEMERLLSELLVGSDRLVVDVSEADFVDSSFLRNVLVADRRAKEQDKVFRLQMDTAPIVRRAFEVSGVLEQLTVVHNRDDALA